MGQRRCLVAAGCQNQGMALAGPERLTLDAVYFWRREFGSVSKDLEEWLGERVQELAFLWGHIVRMNQSQAMWRELTDRLEAVDPTNPWTRHYDGVYFESQVLSVTRIVRAGVAVPCLRSPRADLREGDGSRTGHHHRAGRRVQQSSFACTGPSGG